ncbi:hypothetical protein MRX96_026624 [Rhipicephalus microplus]
MLQLLTPLPFEAEPCRASQPPGLAGHGQERPLWSRSWRRGPPELRSVPGLARPLQEQPLWSRSWRRRVSILVVFVNRHDLYVIVAVLGVAILNCACVLGYSFSNFTMLKRNVEEVAVRSSPGQTPQIR